MTRRFLALVAWVASSLVSLTDAQANVIRDCASFLPFEATQISNNYAMKIAFIKIVNQNNFEDLKKKGLLGVALGDFPLNAEWSEFERRRSEFMESTRLDMDIRHSYGMLSYSIPEAGFQVAKECVDKLLSQGGVRITYFDHVADRSVIKVSFNPGPLPEGMVEVNVAGGVIDFRNKPSKNVRLLCKSACEIPLVIFRGRKNNGDFDAISITASAHPYAADPITIPPLYSVGVDERWVPSSEGSSAYGGWGIGGEERKGNVVCAVAEDRGLFVFDEGKPVWKAIYTRRSERGETPHERTSMRLEGDYSRKQVCAACWVYPIAKENEVYCDGTLSVLQRKPREPQLTTGYRALEAFNSALNALAPQIDAVAATLTPFE